MTAWHRSRRADAGLRIAGLALCGIAYGALSRLCVLASMPGGCGAIGFALAVAGFLGASAGSAMALLGRHLFDPVVVSERWRPRAVDRD